MPLLTWRSILSCAQLVVGSKQTVSVEYTLGGRPAILIPSQLMNGTGLCGYNANNVTNTLAKNRKRRRWWHFRDRAQEQFPVHCTLYVVFRACESVAVMFPFSVFPRGLSV